MQKKIFIIIGIVCVVAVGAGFFWYDTQNEWSTYDNAAYGYSVEYPKTWKLGVYHSQSKPEWGITHVGFDPQSVPTQDEFQTRDLRLGTVAIFPEPAINVSAKEDATIGSASIPAKFFKIAFKKEHTEVWENITLTEYHIKLPSQYASNGFEYLVVAVSYPTERENDQDLQKQISHTLDSFQFK